jgi:hypothetical protein
MPPHIPSPRTTPTSWIGTGSSTRFRFPFASQHLTHSPPYGRNRLLLRECPKTLSPTRSVSLFFLSHILDATTRRVDFSPRPFTTCTIVLSYLSDPFYFLFAPQPRFCFHDHSFQFLALSVPQTSVIVKCRPHLFHSELSSFPRENSPSPAFCELQRASLANRLLHSWPHTTDSLASRLRLYLFIRGAPLACCAPVPSQIRRASSLLYFNTSRDSSPEPP